jgi:hypothetical protein
MRGGRQPDTRLALIERVDGFEDGIKDDAAAFMSLAYGRRHSSL